MHLKLLIMATAAVGLMNGTLYADPLLDSATQLIPQDSHQPIVQLAQTHTETTQPKIEKSLEILGKNASGESQTATMDQSGRWTVKKQDKVISQQTAPAPALPPSNMLGTPTLSPDANDVPATPNVAQPAQPSEATPTPTIAPRNAPASNPGSAVTTATSPGSTQKAVPAEPTPNPSSVPIDPLAPVNPSEVVPPNPQAATPATKPPANAAVQDLTPITTPSELAPNPTSSTSSNVTPRPDTPKPTVAPDNVLTTPTVTPAETESATSAAIPAPDASQSAMPPDNLLATPPTPTSNGQTTTVPIKSSPPVSQVPQVQPTAMPVATPMNPVGVQIMKETN